MNMTITTSHRRLQRRLRGFASTVALGMILMTASTALADQVSGEVCMGKLFFDATGQKLNCTSKDIRIAEATNVSPMTCTDGEIFDLTATFRVELSGGGATRSDLGLYFGTGDEVDQDGARFGECSLSVIQAGDGGYVQLDPPPTPVETSMAPTTRCSR